MPNVVLHEPMQGKVAGDTVNLSDEDATWAIAKGYAHPASAPKVADGLAAEPVQVPGTTPEPEPAPKAKKAEKVETPESE